jgi:cell division protein FtsI/penicillin-binding protein 2
MMQPPAGPRIIRTAYQIPRNRITTLFLIFVLFIGLIGYRVVSVQVVSSSDLSSNAVAERMQENVVPARRGEIFDARGVRLATNVPANRVSAIIDQVPDKHAAAVALSPLIGRPMAEIEQALNEPDLEWVLLARHLSPEVSQQIESLAIPGIVLDPEPSRMYPFGQFASHVLGFTNYDLQGNYGVEGQYDDLLGGTPGRLVGERDGLGNVIGLSPSTWDAPEDGADVVLTLDSAVQRAIEQILDDTIREQQAQGGTIIVQDAKTGAILGMANRKTFDPNAFTSVTDASTFLNPAVSAIYEPGSTFKAIVMAIGIDEGVVTPNSTHNDEPGYFELPDGSRITNFEGSVWGTETMTQVLQRSSNLGAMHVAEKIGRDRFYQNLLEFGIGQPTGVDLQGEEGGILTLPNQEGWNDALFYTNAFGQGVAVTPLQLVSAFSAVINGGKLMQPYIVSEVRERDGETTVTQPEVVRQVISEQSSATMRTMLQSVVEHEESLYPRVDGYHIGAKTGTAQIPSPDGGYIENASIASIVGFGPTEDPRFTVLVKLDWPKGGATGLQSSGPALAKVFEELVLLYGIPPSDAAGTAAARTEGTP